MPDDDNPFSVLRHLRASLPSTPIPDTPAKPGKAPKPPRAAPARAVVRIERKGRGSKEATVIDKLTLTGAELEEWCREMKHAFGCGGSVESGEIVLAGDQRDRAMQFLEKAGVAKIVRG